MRVTQTMWTTFMRNREALCRVCILRSFAAFLRRKVAADLAPTRCYGGASRVATYGSIGFQPVILTFVYRQEACSTLLEWSRSAHKRQLNQNTPIILCRKLACERLLYRDGPLSIRSQASFLQRKRLKLTHMRSAGRAAAIKFSNDTANKSVSATSFVR